MKKKNICLCVLAAMAATACTNDEHLAADSMDKAGDNGKQAGIVFSGGSSNVTRADATGATAANLLGRQFRVYGTKTTPTLPAQEFDNYRVDYNGRIGSDSTNTHGWTYLDNTSLGEQPAHQTIKYWDFSAPRYDFVAFAGLPDTKRITSTVANTISVDAANKGKLFISDRVTATQDSSYTGSTANMRYAKGPVTMPFKRLQARLRIGFYETIPGYAVKDLRFYYGDNYLAMAGTSAKTTAALRGAFPTAGDYTVGYDHDNKVTVNFDGGDTADSFEFGQLQYTKARSSLVAGGFLNADGTVSSTGEECFLATSAAQPTYAIADATLDEATVNSSQWQPQLPYPNNNTNLVLRVDFTLVSTDGVGAPIQVKGASAVVRTEYAQWKPNYAYTYIFKITDKTNGTTGTTEPNPDDPDKPNPEPGTDTDKDSGLYPITFDAEVSSYEEYQQETITAMTAMGGDAITTYSKTSDVTNNDEYKVGEDIVVSSVSKGRWAVAYSQTMPQGVPGTHPTNTYTYTILAGDATTGKTIDQNATNKALFRVEQAGYYIVWLRYLPAGRTDTEANYTDVYKVVKTVE